MEQLHVVNELLVARLNDRLIANDVLLLPKDIRKFVNRAPVSGLHRWNDDLVRFELDRSHFV